ncbi:hypothetical protein E2542_SST08282 [Spatholobus suberectus]|nr:hypothetical protein E2542_SST08282 [Spatholobus suberectus]
MKISVTLLTELASRWVEKGGGFRIKSKIIAFTPLDVCLALGLRIVGEDVKFKEDLDCHTRRLFEGKEVTVKMVFEHLVQLDNNDDVEDFCRLYILLGLAEFYFPKTTPTVHGWLFKLLDDLHSLGKYNWGVVVYEYLVDSLC